MRTFKVNILIYLVAALLLQSACNDNDLAKVAKSMQVVAVTIGEIQKNVITAADQKLINESTAKGILGVCERVSVAGKQIDAVLRAIDKLDPQSRKNIIVLLTPISQALDPDQLGFISGIKNEATRQKIEGGFVVARTTISSIQIVVAASGGQ
jgi:hypothetical protein